MNLLSNEYVKKELVYVYYPLKKLTKLAENEVKIKTGLSVELFLDYYDVSQYGLYTIGVKNVDDLSEEFLDKLNEEFGDPQYGAEFTRNIVDSLTNGYGVGGECPEYKGMEYTEGLDLPIKFKLEDYIKFKESQKEKNWSIPVTWEVASIVNVKAKTIKEAYLKVKNDEMIPLPDDSFYIDGSFRTTYDEEDIQLVEELYNSKDGEYND